MWYKYKESTIDRDSRRGREITQRELREALGAQRCFSECMGRVRMLGNPLEGLVNAQMP